MAESKKHGAPLKRRVWRITKEAPLGEFVDPDHVPPRRTAVQSEPRTGWAISTLDLLHGVDVDEASDTVPDELFDELFKPPPTGS